jgi:hypothetical protein
MLRGGKERPQRLSTAVDLHVPMAKKPSDVKYQCAWNGKVFDSEEQVLKECEGPYQPFIKHYDRYPKKGFFGTVVWRKAKKD